MTSAVYLGCKALNQTNKNLLPKPLAICCGPTARFVSEQVGNPEYRFSHDVAHYVVLNVVPVMP